MASHGANHWNPARLAMCCCGWAQRFPNLREANIGIDQHLAEGCEGCDHAVDLSLAPEKEEAR